MFRHALLSAAATAGLALSLNAAPSYGQDVFTVDKLTFLTFSGPVRMPGVTLPAGTYRFHLADSGELSSRKVIQVMSRDRHTVYGMFNTVSDWRPVVTSETTVTFKETRADAPPAVRSLFYAGEHQGYEFIYPKMKPAIAIDEFTTKQQAVTHVEQNVAENRTAPAAIEPQPEPQAQSEQLAPPSAPEERPAATSGIAESKELPKTSSTMPSFGLLGFGAMFLGFGVSALRRRLS
jgi:LPXTG-motif cell wall-anchored protein